ncbi:2-C-methyl-D-erythritol 4-phosphate cytidylyltransferase [Alteromonas halophila]|uniref:2-C-methyl-D-erythritol 4-phosphate cytidylyltransferase n=1 Tax=Alteromonas halophila TaxID=516698 RepID=A0A918JK60_9ALTE|nr:2-C-methyl-D-erythritol 4-phosphate cytidylyltransferase [Alteromonas halophila]GGW79929.1 2-C-methyl-D-erythritol 4-phosphate cytidylyltransferase [Alteromonas halophila]
MSDSPTIVAVVPAAGIGSRMQADRPKQYLKLGNKTVLEHTLSALATHPRIARVIVAVSRNDPYFDTLPLAHSDWLIRVEGGTERADSVFNALQYVDDDEWALVHDAARPCVTHMDIDSLLEVVQWPDVKGGILATPVRDTMKRAQAGSLPLHVAHTECREDLWHALTPQLFPASLLKNSLREALNANIRITDEASAIEWAGYRVALIDSNPANIKITRPADMPLAAFYLNQQDTVCE